MTLSDYLTVKGLTADQFGSSLKHPVSGHSIRRYIRGEREPSLRTIAEMKEASGGLVTADDWLPSENPKRRVHVAA